MFSSRKISADAHHNSNKNYYFSGTFYSYLNLYKKVYILKLEN